MSNIFYNSSVSLLYEHAIKYENSRISSTGALICLSGPNTGRCPKDKRIVKENTSENDIWWGPVNMPMNLDDFVANKQSVQDYLDKADNLYIIDGYAGWSDTYRLKIRVICLRAYHALFMKNMLIPPTTLGTNLTDFDPDFTIYNTGKYPALNTNTLVAINFGMKQMIILGTEYAGEMKKGVFSIMHYYLPNKNVLTLHSAANEGQNGEVSLFFGLSGTGKTTLSADPNRKLIGDDEHAWVNNNSNEIFNIEGGCYAKCINITQEKEPEIFNAIKFGSVLENVVYDNETRIVDYDSAKITENTRCCYPISFINNSKVPSMGKSPTNIIMLSCDTFGLLPPVSKLTVNQALYYFIQGYTAKIAGTEVGIQKPVPVFSACFGDAFLVHHPLKYAKMLKELLIKTGANAWLLNTGWSGCNPTPCGSKCNPTPSGLGCNPTPSGSGCNPPPCGSGCKPPPCGSGCNPTPCGSKCNPTPSGSGCNPTPSGSGCNPTPCGSGCNPTSCGSGCNPTPSGSGCNPTPSGSGCNPTPCGSGGERIKLKWTRAIIDAIHNNTLSNEYFSLPLFNLQIPKTCPNVPDEILNPVWPNTNAYNNSLHKLATIFINNFEQFSTQQFDFHNIKNAGPQIKNEICK